MSIVSEFQATCHKKDCNLGSKQKRTDKIFKWVMGSITGAIGLHVILMST